MISSPRSSKILKKNILTQKKWLKVCGGGGGGGPYFFLHISSSQFEIRLHVENQLPGLTGSVLKFLGQVEWCGWANQLLCHSQLELYLSWAVTMTLKSLLNYDHKAHSVSNEHTVSVACIMYYLHILYLKLQYFHFMQSLLKL